MNFRKKHTGHSWDKEYYWIAAKQNYKFKVDYNERFSSFTLSVKKDDEEIFSSLWNGIKLKTADDAFLFAEEWVAERITERTWRKTAAYPKKSKFQLPL